MAASYGAHTIAGGETVNTTINVPASTGDGDLLILRHTCTNLGTGLTATLPAGWTALGTAQTGSDGSFGFRHIMATRTASSEPADYTVTHASCFANGMIIRIDGTGTLSVDVSSQNQSNSGTTITATAVSPTVTDALLLYFGINWDVGALTPPTGMTERQDSDFLYLASQTLSASGTTGTRTQSVSNPPWLGNLVAIKDVAGGGTKSPPIWHRPLRFR